MRGEENRLEERERERVGRVLRARRKMPERDARSVTVAGLVVAAETD